MNVNTLFNALNGTSFSTGTTAKVAAPVVAVAPPQAVGPAVIPYFNPERTFTYSREQIEQMRRDSGEDLTHLEITDPQNDPDGDGMALEQEIELIQANATDKAIKDGAMDVPEIAPSKELEIAPLAILAGLAWLLF